MKKITLATLISFLSLTTAFSQEDKIYYSLWEAQKSPLLVYHLSLGWTNLEENVDFSSFVNLESLNISGNKLKEFPLGIETLKKIKSLNFSANSFKSIPDFIYDLKTLEQLDLSLMKLERVSQKISNLQKLRILDLEHCKLDKIPEFIGELESLEELILTSNNLNYLPNSLGKLLKLKKLEFRYNPLLEVPSSISKLSQLKILNLTGLGLSTLPLSFANLDSLELLYLEGNNLTELPEDIGKSNRIKEITLHGNSLVELPESIGELTHLKNLDLSDQNLTALPSSIGNLSQLNTLNLARNKLAHLPESVSQMDSLTSLNLISNPLSKLPKSIGNLINIDSLNLYGSHIKKLPDSFWNLENLTYLNLTGNNLKTISPKVRNLSGLTELYLSTNNLKSIPSDIAFLSDLKTLDISFNKIKVLPTEISELKVLTKLIAYGTLIPLNSTSHHHMLFPIVVQSKMNFDNAVVAVRKRTKLERKVDGINSKYVAMFDKNTLNLYDIRTMIKVDEISFNSPIVYGEWHPTESSSTILLSCEDYLMEFNVISKEFELIPNYSNDSQPSYNSPLQNFAFYFNESVWRYSGVNAITNLSNPSETIINIEINVNTFYHNPNNILLIREAYNESLKKGYEFSAKCYSKIHPNGIIYDITPPDEGYVNTPSITENGEHIFLYSYDKFGECNYFIYHTSYDKWVQFKSQSEEAKIVGVNPRKSSALIFDVEGNEYSNNLYLVDLKKGSKTVVYNGKKSGEISVPSVSYFDDKIIIGDDGATAAKNLYIKNKRNLAETEMEWHDNLYYKYIFNDANNYFLTTKGLININLNSVTHSYFRAISPALSPLYSDIAYDTVSRKLYLAAKDTLLQLGPKQLNETDYWLHKLKYIQSIEFENDSTVLLHSAGLRPDHDAVKLYISNSDKTKKSYLFDELTALSPELFAAKKNSTTYIFNHQSLKPLLEIENSYSVLFDQDNKSLYNIELVAFKHKKEEIRKVTDKESLSDLSMENTAMFYTAKGWGEMVLSEINLLTGKSDSLFSFHLSQLDSVVKLKVKNRYGAESKYVNVPVYLDRIAYDSTFTFDEYGDITTQYTAPSGYRSELYYNDETDEEEKVWVEIDESDDKYSLFYDNYRTFQTPNLSCVIAEEESIQLSVLRVIENDTIQLNYLYPLLADKNGYSTTGSLKDVIIINDSTVVCTDYSNSSFLFRLYKINNRYPKAERISVVDQNTSNNYTYCVYNNTLLMNEFKGSWKKIEFSSGKVSSSNYLSSYKNRSLRTSKQNLRKKIIGSNYIGSRTINGYQFNIIPISENSYIIKTDDNYYLQQNALNYIAFIYKNKAYPIEQFDLKYNRPDIVLERLGFADSTLIQAYHQAYLKRLKKMNFTEEMLEDDFHLPKIKIKNFEEIPTIEDQGSIELKLNMYDNKYKLDRCNVWVNDVAIYGVNGISLRELNTNEHEKSIVVKLAKGKNKVQVSVLNQAGAESYKETIELESSYGKTKPDLYLITIGESEFKQSEFNLTYAAKDAHDIANLLNESSVYENVKTKTLTNNQVTKSQILQLREFLKEANINDQVVIFVAGHGVLDANLDYFLATYDMDFNNPSENGLAYETLENILDAIAPLKKTLIIDACHSGEIDKDDLALVEQNNTESTDIQFRAVGKAVSPKLGTENITELMKSLFTDLRKGTGATIISSAGGMEYAMESSEWQNGLFTYCMLEGIRTKKADLNSDGEIWLSEVQEYVGKEVNRLSNGMQKPTSRIENQAVDFRIWKY
ncbi:MAG: caspase family protein [Crocinitomicaceae bacterium]